MPRLVPGDPADLRVGEKYFRERKDSQAAPTKIEKFNEGEFVPTLAYRKQLERILKTRRDDHNEGARFYNKRQAEFSKFFDQDEPMDAASFAARYQTSLDSLYENYLVLRAKHQQNYPSKVADKRGDDPDMRPEIDRLEQLEIHEGNVDRLLKEYWITASVFGALTKLDEGDCRRSSSLDAQGLSINCTRCTRRSKSMCSRTFRFRKSRISSASSSPTSAFSSGSSDSRFSSRPSSSLPTWN